MGGRWWRGAGTGPRRNLCRSRLLAEPRRPLPPARPIRASRQDDTQHRRRDLVRAEPGPRRTAPLGSARVVVTSPLEHQQLGVAAAPTYWHRVRYALVIDETRRFG